jgi:hypothetical protein
VVREGLARGGCEAVNIADLGEGVHRGSELEIDDGVGLVREKAAHDEDSGIADAAFAEMDSFFNGADGQPSDSFGEEDARNFEGAVPIGVGLDDTGDLGSGRDNAADTAVVAGNLLAGNQDVRAKRGEHSFSVAGGFSRRAARKQNRCSFLLVFFAIFCKVTLRKPKTNNRFLEVHRDDFLEDGGGVGRR